MTREWSIHTLAKTAGVTSRTLRHYGDLGLLEPARIGAGGVRFYDTGALTRLQRILLLRDLGLRLAAIGQILDGQRDTASALRTHLELLEHDRRQLDRRIEAVRSTLRNTERGDELVPEEVFDGFDHTHYRDEVIERWGQHAYDESDRWWRSMTHDEQTAWKNRVDDLSRAWTAAAAAGLDPTGPEALDLARRHVAWLASIPGTPGHSSPHGPPRDYVLGLAEMYVADERFAANYGGVAGATFVRDALHAYM